MSFPFYKLVGAGNDFIFVSHNDIANYSHIENLVVEVCDRNFGVGADGFVIIKNHSLEENHSTFEWDFYNNDGSLAEMCGNAARCAVIYNQAVYGADTCTFKTEIGMINGTISNKGSIVTWEIESSEPEKKVIEIENGKKVEGWFVDTGVPHFVILDEGINGRDCLLIQQHADFGERNTNVTLLKQSGTGPHPTKTFERGVKGFTLACGTGVIACGTVLKKLTSEIKHQMQAPGGLLSVEFHDDKTVSLEGPAQLVFQGKYQ